jgi:hypothetical protein
MEEKFYNEKLYKIIFEGEIMEGYILDEVKKKLSGIFKWNQDKVDELFSVVPLEIADNIDYRTAMTYKAPFEKAGAICKIYHPEKGLIIEQNRSASSHLNYLEVDSHHKKIYPQYDFGQPKISESINGRKFNKNNMPQIGLEPNKETEQNRQKGINITPDSNIPTQVEREQSLNKQKDALYESFSNIYKQAKKETAVRAIKLIIYPVIGIFFLLAFTIPMVAAMRGLYVIGISGGFLMASIACIIKYPINNKINKNSALKIALYFIQHISIENQKNPSLFLAALILWAEKISDIDPAKDEMLSVINEIVLVHTMDQDMLKKYLTKIGDLENQVNI